LTVNFSAYCHAQRNRGVFELHGKIIARLVHVESDADYCQVWQLALRAHLHQHAGNFTPTKLNVVGQLGSWLEAEFGANDVGNGFDCPNRESP